MRNAEIWPPATAGPMPSVCRWVEIEDRIAELVPRSAAGAAAQLRLLRQWGRDYEWDEPQEQLTDKLLAGA